MNRGLKITLIVVGSLAVAGGITFGIVKKIRKRNEQREALEKELQQSQALQQVQQELESTQDTKNNQIIPVRNLDKVVNNSFKEINGVKLYPAKKSNDPVQGHPFAEGFANIRETPEVNNSQGVWDLWQDNLLGKVSAGASIGTIVSEQYDNLTPKMRWFKVKLSKPIDGEKYGWVRGDNVTFQPFTKNKKSSFDGAFVQKYDNSYQLGADVFPHPNWMIQYRAYAGDEVSSNFSGDLDLNL